jgi:hypothetical protein
MLYKFTQGQKDRENHGVSHLALVRALISPLSLLLSLWEFHRQPCRYRMQLSASSFAQLFEHRMLRPMAALLGLSDLLRIPPVFESPDFVRSAYDAALLVAAAGDVEPYDAGKDALPKDVCEQTPHFSQQRPFLPHWKPEEDVGAAVDKANRMMRHDTDRLRATMQRVLEQTAKLRVSSGAKSPLLLLRSITPGRSLDWQAGTSELNPALRSLARVYNLAVNEVSSYPPHLCNKDHHHWSRAPAMQALNQLVNIDVASRAEAQILTDVVQAVVSPDLSAAHTSALGLRAKTVDTALAPSLSSGP